MPVVSSQIPLIEKALRYTILGMLSLSLLLLGFSSAQSNRLSKTDYTGAYTFRASFPTLLANIVAERGQKRSRAFTVPSQLATLTDLKPQEVQAITEALNPLLADTFALYTKTKNYHWHLAGSYFREYHLLFDEHATALLASIDILAERVRRMGGTTIRSISHIGQLQIIKDDNEDFVPAGEMVQRLLGDTKHLTQMLRAAHEVCERSRDVATASELETIIDETERRTWFLFEVI